MVDQNLDLENWRRLHKLARASFDGALSIITESEAPTPAGSWTARDIVEHVEAEHSPTDTSACENVNALQMLALDLAVHSWDLHRSQGRISQLDDELCIELHRAFAPFTHLMAQDGAFAPPTEVPENAPPQAKLIALTGRDPEWSPPRD